VARVKVLHVSSGNLYGGIETMLVTMARHREECPGLEQHFALSFEGRLSEELRQTGVPVDMVGRVRIGRPWTVRRARRALRQVIRRIGCEVVVCHGPWSLVVFGASVCRGEVPVVLWAHGAYSGRHWLERLAALRPPDLVVSNSRFTQRHVERWMPSVPRTVIMCPVHMSEDDRASEARSAIRHEFHTPADAMVVALVSRMEPSKGHMDLLEALGGIGTRSDWCCWLIGGAQTGVEQGYLDQLREFATNAGIADRVRFTGQRQDVGRILAAADVYCQPNSAPEGFGITLVEAMAASLPVVASAVGGALEIVDESCGRLVPAGDIPVLRATIEQLFHDAARRVRLGTAGAVRARRLCDPRERLVDLETALRQLTRKPASRGPGMRAAESAMEHTPLAT
jgi:glycosyltransferase involved in cell wall biosynthesis